METTRVDHILEVDDLYSFVTNCLVEDIRDEYINIIQHLNYTGSTLPGMELLGEEETEEPGVDYELIEQLVQTDPPTQGTRPASKSAVEELLKLRVSKELLQSINECCPICQDEFELEEDIQMMPCSHMYHTTCLLPWLKLHNTCPSCRYELPTRDIDYENQNMDVDVTSQHYSSPDSFPSTDLENLLLLVYEAMDED